MRDTRLLAEIGALVAIAEAGSFTSGGRTVGLTPSGASRAISRLEQRIGNRLLDRTTRSVRLTDAGDRLHTLARPHLAGLEEAAAAASNTAKAVSGRLRVAANPIVLSHLLAPHLSRLADQHPNLCVEFVQGETGDLTRSGIDLAIRFGPQPPSSMSSLRLLETRVLTVASPGYIARHGRPNAPDELSRHVCLHYLDPWNRRPFEWEFERHQQVLPVAVDGPYTFTDVGSLVAATCAGTGIAQLLALGSEALIAAGALVEVFPDWPGETFPLYAVRPSRRLAPAAVEAFIAFSKEACSAKRR